MSFISCMSCGRPVSREATDSVRKGYPDPGAASGWCSSWGREQALKLSETCCFGVGYSGDRR